MTLTKREFVDNQTRLTAEIMNDFQDAIIALEQKIPVKSGNILNDCEFVEGYFWNLEEVASASYGYFSEVPVKAGVTYAMNKSARFLAFFDTSKTYLYTLQNTTEFTPNADGYVNISIGIGGQDTTELTYSSMLTKEEQVLEREWIGAASQTDMVKARQDLNDLIQGNAVNLVDTALSVSGFLNTNGTVVEATTYRTTDFIAVKAGATYLITPSFRKFILYTTDKTYIADSFLDAETTNYTFTPTVDGYVRFSYAQANESRVSLVEQADEVSVVTTEPINLLDVSESVAGYLSSNDSVAGSETYKTSGHIPVVAGVTYKITPFLRKFLLLDDSMTPITSSFVDKGVYDYEFTPDVDGYVRFTYYTSGEEDTVLESVYPSDGTKISGGVGLSSAMQEEVKMLVEKVATPIVNAKAEETLASALTGGSLDVLHGKKWWACGDSFTEASDEDYDPEAYPNITVYDMNYPRKTYPFFIGARNGMVVHNFSRSGQTLATPATEHSNTCFTTAGWYDQIPEDVDYITLWFGINDSHHRPDGTGGDGESNTGEIPLGTIDDTTVNTFYGAWNFVLKYLIENHPFAKIGIIVSNGCELVDGEAVYAEATIAAAKKWGIAYLDLNGDYSVPLMLRVNNKSEVCAEALSLRRLSMSIDAAGGNEHPNAKAHEYQSTFIEHWMRSL